jgi:hypothetical protein
MSNIDQIDTVNSNLKQRKGKQPTQENDLVSGEAVRSKRPKSKSYVGDVELAATL